MPRPSSGSVRRAFLKRDKALDLLKGCASRLVAERPDVVRVLLFGSLARGDHGPRSDADVIIILSRSDEPRFMDRIPDLLDYFLPAHVPVDLLPYTEAEVERMVREGNPLVRRALAEGIELASAA